MAPGKAIQIGPIIKPVSQGGGTWLSASSQLPPGFYLPPMSPYHCIFARMPHKHTLYQQWPLLLCSHLISAVHDQVHFTPPARCWEDEYPGIPASLVPPVCKVTCSSVLPVALQAFLWENKKVTPLDSLREWVQCPMFFYIPSIKPLYFH